MQKNMKYKVEKEQMIISHDENLYLPRRSKSKPKKQNISNTRIKQSNRQPIMHSPLKNKSQSLKEAPVDMKNLDWDEIVMDATLNTLRKYQKQRKRK